MRCSNQYHFNLWLNQPIVESTHDRINSQLHNPRLHNPRLQSQRKSKSKVKESQTAPAIRRWAGAAGAHRSGPYPGIYAPASWELGRELQAGAGQLELGLT